MDNEDDDIVQGIHVQRDTTFNKLENGSKIKDNIDNSTPIKSK